MEKLIIEQAKKFCKENLPKVNYYVKKKDDSNVKTKDVTPYYITTNINGEEVFINMEDKIANLLSYCYIEKDTLELKQKEEIPLHIYVAQEYAKANPHTTNYLCSDNEYELVITDNTTDMCLLYTLITDITNGNIELMLAGDSLWAVQEQPEEELNYKRLFELSGSDLFN